MSSLLSIGSQAVKATQSGLSIAGNNISNVNTPGYNRQIPTFLSRETRGVVVEDFHREVSQLINARIWSDSSRFEAAQTFERFANQLDNTLASDSTSLSVKYDDYFESLQAANDDPTSISSRELFVSEAASTVRRFRDIHERISLQNQEIDTRIREITQEINSQASVIADLNDRIRIAKAGGREPLELLDQREQAVKELSEMIDVSVIDQTESEIGVFIANGLPLVVGTSTNPLVASQNDFDPSQYDVSVMLSGRENNITNFLSGGELGGALTYRRDVLNKSLDELGRASLVFSDTMNRQHQLGMDMDGNMGQLLFRNINDGPQINSRFQSANIDGDVVITDTSQLHASEYDLVFTSDNQFRLTRLSDGKMWTNSAFEEKTAANEVTGENQLYLDAGAGELTLQVDGFKVTAQAPSVFHVNEQIRIQPVRFAASDMRLEINSGKELALASPVKISRDAANTGNGRASISVNELSQSFTKDPRVALAGVMPNSGNPIVLEKISDAPLDFSLTHDAGVAFTFEIDPEDPRNIIIKSDEVPPLLGELKVRIEGNVDVGDKFELGFNFEIDAANEIQNIGISDNRNGLLIADLTSTRTSLEGTYQETYSRIVERVGVTTRIAQMDTRASQAVLQNSINQREEISGVNLDEEAVKLVQFQQAYVAATQLITASQRTFDALISAV